MADTLIFSHLRQSGAVETASSEETSEMVEMGGKGFAVAFDPVDGSSIIASNWSVGSIFGIWPGGRLLGQHGRSQVAALYGVYGPRTILVISRPVIGGPASQLIHILPNCRILDPPLSFTTPSHVLSSPSVSGAKRCPIFHSSVWAPKAPTMTQYKI